MKKFFLFVFISLVQFGFAQNTIGEVLKKYNKDRVTYITVEKAQQLQNAVFLDARETNEFQVSHIATAKYVGYNNFDPIAFSKLKIDKNAPIVVYCSVGVRSEQIGDRLQRMGYTNVFNLYGGIFEWKNKNGAIVDTNNKKTNKMHCYSSEWGKYLTNGDCAYD